MLEAECASSILRVKNYFKIQRGTTLRIACHAVFVWLVDPALLYMTLFRARFIHT